MPTPEQSHPLTEVKDKNRETAEKLAERLKLKEQYLAQVKALYQARLLLSFPATNEHPKPELGIIGVDEKQHYLPTYEEIIDRLSANPEKTELIAKKVEQGFTKLLLNPFAIPLETIVQAYRETLLKINQQPGGIKSTDGTSLELDIENPLYVWPDLIKSDLPQTPPAQQLEYQVQDYEGITKSDRKGQYKSELFQDPTNAWQILLVEDIDIPAPGQGQTISGRKQLEANQSAKDYLRLLQTDPQYQGEQGLTPEAQLTLALTHLWQSQTVINDWQGSGKANRLAGTFLAGFVPDFYWFRDDRLPRLSGDNPDLRNSYYGFSPAVSV